VQHSGDSVDLSRRQSIDVCLKAPTVQLEWCSASRLVPRAHLSHLSRDYDNTGERWREVGSLLTHFVACTVCTVGHSCLSRLRFENWIYCTIKKYECHAGCHRECTPIIYQTAYRLARPVFYNTVLENVFSSSCDPLACLSVPTHSYTRITIIV